MKLQDYQTPEQLSQKLNGIISSDRLIQLANAQLIPHYRIDERITFVTTEAEKWIKNNLVLRCPGLSVGNEIATVINVVSPSLEKIDVPIELRGIGHMLIPLDLQSIEASGFSGVYFLCHKGQVVYVGQSVEVMQRVGAHVGKKTFDFVLFVRVPASDLDFVETAYIRNLRPKYNYSKCGKHLIHPPERNSLGNHSGESEQLVAFIRHNPQKDLEDDGNSAT